MRVWVTTTFIDKQAEDPASAEIEAGRTITVTQQRGEELIAAGVAEAAEATKRAGRKPRAPSAAAAPAPPAGEPASPAPPAADIDPGSTAA